MLLADEPTGSLDTQRGREVLELLRGLCRERGVAVVLVSHDPMAAHYADRVYALRDGRLCDYDTDRVSHLADHPPVGEAGGPATPADRAPVGGVAAQP
jgi:ABC-type lipoprotein export system ATPase subunit